MIELLFFLRNNVSKRLNLFFTIIIVVILWYQRFVDSIILSKNERVILEKKIKPVIEFHRERVLFSLVISQTVLACQHEIFELIHETSP